MESSVAIRDATPAIHVVVAANFCPVPPAISAPLSVGEENSG